MTLLLAALIGYLFGSFPTGLMIGKLHGVDPRTVGSGRTGGTNVYRAAGKLAGLLTAFLDIFKGAIAMGLVGRYVDSSTLATALTGLMAVLGHNWSLFLGFKGGAGTMTNWGGLLWLHWPLALLGGLLGIVTFLFSRMSSLASLLFALFVPIGLAVAVAWGRVPADYLVYVIGTALLISYSLLPNIRRILAGTERRVGGDAGTGR